MLLCPIRYWITNHKILAFSVNWMKVKHASRTPISSGSGIYWMRSKQVLIAQVAWKGNTHSQLPAPPARSRLPQGTAIGWGGNISSLFYWLFEMLTPTEEDCCSARVQLRSGSEGKQGKEFFKVINLHFTQEER